MLHKNHISHIEIYTPEWEQYRLGRFTSSRINNLMSEKALTAGSISYIDQKAAEYITGQSGAPEDEVLEDENTAWGLQYENEALQVFGREKKLQYLVTQKMISDPNTRFSSTPDAIWVIESSVTQPDCYNVATVEVKCPRKYPRFLSLYRCITPKDLKKENRIYYWQVLDQMDNCGAVQGFFLAYHPLFPGGKNFRLIEFRHVDLWEDFALLQQRKILAVKRFYEIVSEFVG